MTQELTQDLLHELFAYKDNQLFWRSKRNPMIDLSKPAGTLNTKGYLRIGINGKIYYAHRFVFLMHHGYLPEQIDHIDGNRANNAIENLRPATNSQNQQNRAKQKTNTSGYKGVHWRKDAGKWQAQIAINGKRKHLGYFDTAEQAHEAYCKTAIELHGEFANFG